MRGGAVFGMRSLVIAIINILIAAPMQSWAQPLSPKPPALKLFSDCTNSDDPAPFESMQTCFPPAKQIANQVGSSVDGDTYKRHFTRYISRMSIKDSSGISIVYKISQLAYDCISRQGLRRTVNEFVDIPGIGIRPLSSMPTDHRKWTPESGLEIGFLRGRCPAKTGFTGIGNLQFAFGQAMRSGNIVNIRTIDSEDRSLVFFS